MAEIELNVMNTMYYLNGFPVYRTNEKKGGGMEP
jgi:hypothetical protein